MNVEIVICTWNRSASLEETLKSISRVLLPKDVSLSVLVVDNNSTDDTSQVARKFSEPLNVRLISESRQGHVFARNKAIQNTTSDLLVWTDDDVLVGPKWIWEYVSSAKTFPGIAFFGGPIEPVFQPACPDWITENWFKLSGCFAERQLGYVPFEFSENKLPYGANFAIRTNVQKKFPFDESKGRKRNYVVGDDEIEMLRRVLGSGHTGRWLPYASIQHIIPPYRQTTKFIRNYFVGQGRMLVEKNEQWHSDSARLKRESRWELGCYRIKRAFADSNTWVSHLIRGSLALGQYLALTEVSRE